MYLLLITTVGVIAAGITAEVQTLAGGSVSGDLASFTAEEVLLQTDRGQEKLSTRDLLRIDFGNADLPAEAAIPPVRVWLSDGSSIAAQQITSSKGEARIILAGDHSAAVPAQSLRAVQLATMDDAAKQQFEQLLEKGPAADLIVVKRRDSTAVSFLEGLIGDLTVDEVQFQLDGDTIPVKRDRVLGLIYFQKATNEFPAPLCTVADRFGSAVLAKSLRIETETAAVETLAGVKLSLPTDQLRTVDFSSAKIIYLSDLEPMQFRWTPFLDVTDPSGAMADFYSLRRDRGRSTSQLKLNDQLFSKGISLSSRSEVKYRVPGGVKRLQALAGIEDAYADRGDIVLSIQGDGKSLFSQSVRGNTPVAVDCSIEGVRELTILVDYGDAADIGDHLTLYDARMTK